MPPPPGRSCFPGRGPGCPAVFLLARGAGAALLAADPSWQRPSSWGCPGSLPAVEQPFLGTMVLVPAASSRSRAVEVQGPRPRSWVPDWVEGKGPPTEGALSVSLPSASRRPASPDQRVVYTVLECQPLFDSSDMTITEWVQIAQTIEVTGEPGEGWGVVGRGGSGSGGVAGRTLMRGHTSAAWLPPPSLLHPGLGEASRTTSTVPVRKWPRWPSHFEHLACPSLCPGRRLRHLSAD